MSKRRFSAVASSYGDTCGLHLRCETEEEAIEALKELYPVAVEEGWSFCAVDVDEAGWYRRSLQAAWVEGGHSFHRDPGPYCGPY